MKLSTFWSLAAAISSTSLYAQTVDKPLPVGGDVQPPALVKQVDAYYPRPLFRKPKEGSVLVHMVVDENGLPTLVHVIRSADKKLDRASLEAVTQWRFKPAMRDGKPIAVELNVEVNFRVQ